MFSRFSEEAQKILLMTKKEMYDLKHPYVGSEHFLLAILKNKSLSITKFLENYYVSYNVFKNEIINIIGVGKSNNEWFLFTPLLKRVIENAILNCGENNVVTIEDLFSSLLEEGDGVANRILMGMNIDIDSLYEKFINSFCAKKNNAGKKLLLEDYAVNLNKKYNEYGFDPVLGRDEQINRLIEILLRRTKNNPLLIGDAGVGKTAIVEDFVRRIEMGEVPKKLFNRKVYSLSMASLVAGTKYRGEFEERINHIIDEVENDESIILFIDEIHTLVGAGGAEGAIDASNILKPYLARGKVSIIGATTKEEYIKYIESDKALERRFQKIYVNELSLEQTENILYGLKDIYECFHNVVVEDNVIKEIVNLCNRYVSYGKFPDKAIDLFDEACANASIQIGYEDELLRNYIVQIKKLKDNKNRAIVEHDYKKASLFKEELRIKESEYNNFLLNGSCSKKNNKVSMDIVYNVLFRKTGIPVSHLKGLDRRKLSKKLKNIVFGQDNIIDEIINLTCNCHKSNKNVPLSFLLVGKSGLGKTFLVKEYAKELYNKESFIRLDMSEYKDDFSSSKIIGSPPGYVGYSEYNSLLDQIRIHPYSVLLLDEVEKASPSVLKLFLQVFDEGCLTSSSGEKVDFSNVIVFMTSNLGTNKDEIGFCKDKVDCIKEEFESFLGIEFINRIDRILIFNELNVGDIRKIIKKKLTGFVEKGIISKEKSTILADNILKNIDYNVSGARKIDKVIDKTIEENLILNI